MDTITKLKVYENHGMEFSLIGEDEAKGDCPFCDKGGHFFVKPSTGQFNCRRCQAQGNHYSFLKMLWQASFDRSWTDGRGNDVTPEAIQDLANDRGIPIDLFRLWGFCENFLNGEILIPSYNVKGILSNLSR